MREKIGNEKSLWDVIACEFRGKVSEGFRYVCEELIENSMNSSYERFLSFDLLESC